MAKTGSIFDALTYPARKLASYPINAANMHFSVLGDVLRLELFALEESNVSAMSIIRGGTGSLAKAQTQKERENAAELINNMTGWAKEGHQIYRVLVYLLVDFSVHSCRRWTKR